MQTDEVMRRAMIGAAGELQYLAFEAGFDQLREADLKSVIRRAIKSPLAERVIAEDTRGRPSAFRGAQAADLAVERADGSGLHAVCELKWLNDDGKIGWLFWDILKLAFTVDAGIAEAGYLVAAAPRSRFSSTKPLINTLATSRTYDAKRFFADHRNEAAEFDQLNAKRQRKRGPDRVPDFEIRVIGSPTAVLATEGPAWEIRCIRVLAQPGDGFSLPPPAHTSPATADTGPEPSPGSPGSTS